MGRLFQSSMSVSDTPRISIDMWAKVNSASIVANLSPTAVLGDGNTYLVPLIEFGEFSDANSRAPSGIYLQVFIGTGGTLTTLIIVAMSGRANSVSYSSCLAGNWHQNENSFWTEQFAYFWTIGDTPETGTIDAGVWNQNTLYGSSWHPYSYTETGDPTNIGVDRWMHIFGAYDTSLPTTPVVGGVAPDNISSGPLCTLVVNATDQGPFSPFDTASILMPSLSTMQAIQPGLDYSTPYNIFAASNIWSGGYASAFDTGDGSGGPDGASPDPFPGGIVSLTVPAFNIALNGCTIGLPGTFYPNSVVDLANVRVWAGQYIDGVANLDKFVIGNRPADASLAENAFGVPTFKFLGKRKRDFIKNQGTGGDVSTVGTINDIAGPSF